jgi:hypothetical protein
MPFTLIRGTYHIKGYAPDGDSIRFRAHREGNWTKLSGRPVGLNARRHAQLRLEAIDTLETHYKNTHQPMDLAQQAMEFLLQCLGITGMATDAVWSTVLMAQDATEGYILSRATDEYQRPIAFAYAGSSPEQDGASIFLTAERLIQSANYQSLRTGLAYPTYYRGLFHDLRNACNDAVREARRDRTGIWSQDRTNVGFEYGGLNSITEDNVILPKLFRRLVEYMEGGGCSLDGFLRWLEVREEGVWVIPKAHFTHLDTLIEVNGNQIRLLEVPENLVFSD